MLFQSMLCLLVGASSVLAAPTPSPEQFQDTSYDGKETAIVSRCQATSAVDLYLGGSQAETKVAGWAKNYKTTHQRWIMRWQAATQDWMVFNAGADASAKNIVLDLSYGNGPDGTNITGYPAHGGPNQRWIIEKVDNNGAPTQYVRFKNVASATYMDLYGCSALNAAPIVGWHFNATDMAEQWFFEDPNKA